MPFRKERPLTASEGETKSFLFARDDVFERQTGFSPDPTGHVDFTIVPPRAYVARYEPLRMHWIWDSDQSKWIEGAAFDPGGSIIYPQGDGTFVDAFGDPVEESLIRRDREPTEKVVARLRKAMENPTIWEHLDAEDPFESV